ncbi:MAG: peptidoglycan synthetase [Bacteroidetes bacterium]|nr:peptidoglycan synthetase [Bacteroidota bacterium]
MWVHFIAIGGSVMHQLAICLKNKGYKITGSDDEIFEPAAGNLKASNLLPVEDGWFPEKINKNIDAIILGMHARKDNPELIKATELGLKIYSFPEYIYSQSLSKIRVAIAGSHGKTTTTAMVMHVLKKEKKDFDFLVGARLEGFSQSVSITDAPIIVCEADEYPASTLEPRPKFHFLYPHIAVITGIAWDHVNVFPTFEFYLEQFVIFINRIEPHGILIYNEADTQLLKLINDHKRKDITYLPYHLPYFEIEDGVSIIKQDELKYPISVFGIHNLLNLQAARLVCEKLNIPSDRFLKAISDFKGASKRLELIYSTNKMNVYRDFAHAPSKVEASVNAVKDQFPQRKLIAILELHTYSSLSGKFMKEYKSTMDRADEAIVFYSRHALEIKKLPLLEPSDVENGFQKKGLKVVTETSELEILIRSLEKENVNFLFMSSGDYGGLAILPILN